MFGSGVTEPWQLEAVLAEEAKGKTGWTMFYYCRKCLKAWQTQWDCPCNDKCPKCNKEIEAYYEIEGKAEAQDLIERKTALARMIAVHLVVTFPAMMPVVDDWNDTGSYNLIIGLPSEPRPVLRHWKIADMAKQATKVRAFLKRLDKAGVIDLEWIDNPQAEYEVTQFMGERTRTFLGYNRDYIKASVWVR